MKAGIIAAGEGSRLKSEGIAVPKPLVPVDGVPLIERLLSSFRHCGITEVVCIVNEYSLEVKRFVEERRLNIPVRFVVKTTPSSMHSLFALAPSLTDGPFLLSTVDSIFNEEEFSRFLEHAQRRQSVDGVLAVTDYIDDENPLYVQVDRKNRIMGFVREHSSNKSSFDSAQDDVLELVTGGLYVFSPRIFNEVDVALKQGVERLRNFLGHLLQQGYKLEAFKFSKIVDVDHVHDIQTAEELLRAR